MEKERKIDLFLNMEIPIGKWKLKVVDVAFVICLLVFSFLIRWKLMPIISADYFGFLKVWMEEIRQTGGFLSLNHAISNYSSPYMYLMCLVSYFSQNDLYALKMISILFDYVAAGAIFCLVYQITGHVRKSILGMAVFLLCPTVIMNGAYWCQCDVIYTAFVLWALVKFFKEDSAKCMLLIGIAFSIKLQTLFLFPFLIIMWLKNRTIKLSHFLLIPIVYMISALPAWLMGRNFWELMAIYFEQSDYYPWGTLEYPNLYALLGEAMPDLHNAAEVSGAGIWATVILMGVIAYYFYTRKVSLTNEMMVTLALFTVALVVYTLPHMHDRYGFLIDVLAILYGILGGKKLAVTCGFVLVSLLSYMPYLTGVSIISIQYTAIALLTLIVYVGADLYQQVKVQESSL